MPPGKLTDISNFIKRQSYLSNDIIASIGAIAFLSAIAGKSYNTYTGAGLNQYILLLAPTGTGKDEISKGIQRLISAIQKVVPSVQDFKGPGELVSSAGLIKWMEKKSCIISLIGEAGIMLQMMAAPNANANLKGLQRTLLQLYSKSGSGDAFDATAYSDGAKNTAVIDSPSLTVVGESVPHTFYEYLDESMIASGLLPRFMIVEYEGERPYSNINRQTEPCPQLVQELADFVSHCLNLMHLRQTIRVPAEGAAVALLDAFGDGECRKAMEGAGEVVRHLWNRAHLKALKLATLSAISRNPYNPSVCRDDALWAVSMIRSQTERLIGKFSRDEVGLVDGDESKQLAELIKAIGRYFFSPFEELSGYGGFTQDMHRDGVITETFLSRFLTKRAAFKNDRRRGPTEALKRAINNLLSGDELREMPRTQMLAKYGNHARSFVMSDPKRFADARSRELDSGSIR